MSPGVKLQEVIGVGGRGRGGYDFTEKKTLGGGTKFVNLLY